MADSLNNSIISPVFLLSKDIPPCPTPIDHYALCLASAKTAGRGAIIGSQVIGALWRIYPATAVARVALLAKGINIAGKNVELGSQNPFTMRNAKGEEIPSTRLTISDIPLSFSKNSIENALIKKGFKLRSKLKMEGIRDPDGKMTEWLSGRRFVWIDLPKTAIQSTMSIGQYKAKLYYREMKAERECRRCFGKGHVASQCTQEEVCRRCKIPGHRAADCFMTNERRESDLGMESENEFPSLPTLVDSSSHSDTDGSSTDGIDSIWQTVEKKKKKGKRSKIRSKQKEESPNVQLNTTSQMEVTEPSGAEPSETQSGAAEQELGTTFTIGEMETSSPVQTTEDTHSDIVEVSTLSQNQIKETPQIQVSRELTNGTDESQSRTISLQTDTFYVEKETNKHEEGTIPHYFRKTRQQNSNKRPCPDTSTSSEGTPTPSCSTKV